MTKRKKTPATVAMDVSALRGLNETEVTVVGSDTADGSADGSVREDSTEPPKSNAPLISASYFREGFWSTSFVLHWIAYGDPETFGQFSPPSVLYQTAQVGLRDLNPRHTLWLALQDGEIHAIDPDGTEWPASRWAYVSWNKLPEIKFRKLDVMRVWPPAGEGMAPSELINLAPIEAAPAESPALTKLTPKQTAMDEACRLVFPNGIPPGTANVNRDNAIFERMKTLAASAGVKPPSRPSERSFERYFAKMRSG